MRLGYRPALDGIRALAIAGVVLAHVYRWPRGGTTGVDLFFVLSGFLITTLVLEEHELTGTIGLGAFYIRRARRLFPALASMLLVFLVLGAAKGELGWAAKSVLYCGFYTANFILALGHHLLVPRNPVTVLWSLAEEEQFYLLWPTLLILLLRRRSLHARRIVTAAAALLLLEGILLSATDASVSRVLYGPDTRAAELLAGAALALAFRRPVKVSRDLAMIGLVGVLAIDYIGAPYYGLVFVPVTAASMCLIAGVVLHPDTRLARLLSTSPFVSLGKISYSLYLWHLIIFWAFGWELRPLVIPAAVLVAWLSYRYVEQPFRRRRVAAPTASAPSSDPAAVPAT